MYLQNTRAQKHDTGGGACHIMDYLLCHSDDACFHVAGVALDAMPTSHQQPLQQQQDIPLLGEQDS
jgi:hypothetical protein